MAINPVFHIFTIATRSKGKFCQNHVFYSLFFVIFDIWGIGLKIFIPVAC